MFVALQIPLGVLTEPLPLRYFDVILTAVPAPLAVKEAPPTFKYLLVLVIFIADVAVKLPKLLISEALVPESVNVILLAVTVALLRFTLSVLPDETSPNVIFKSPVPRLSVLVTSISESPLPLLLTLALLAIKFRSPFAVVIFALILTLWGIFYQTYLVNTP